MSLHNKKPTDYERKGLEAHGLSADKPSQLSDCFRLGMVWALSNKDLTPINEDNCQSCVNGLCTAGVECVATSNHRDK